MGQADPLDVDQAREARRKEKVPLVCSTGQRIAVQKIKHDYDCSMFLEDPVKEEDIKIRQLVLWRRNTFRRKHKATICRIRVVRIWRQGNTNFPTPFGGIGPDPDERSNDEWDEAVYPDDCIEVNRTKEHSLGVLDRHGGVYRTTNEPTVPETSSAMFENHPWVHSDTRNIYVIETHMTVDGDGRMAIASPFPIYKCKSYTNGYCSDHNQTVIWKPIPSNVEPFNVYNVQRFKITDKISVSVDHRLAFTGVRRAKMGEGDEQTDAIGNAYLCVDDDGWSVNHERCKEITMKVFTNDQGVLFSYLDQDEEPENIHTVFKNDMKLIRGVDSDTADYVQKEFDMKHKKDGSRIVSQKNASNQFKTDIMPTDLAAASIQAVLHFHMREASKALRQVAYHICTNQEWTSRYLIAATAGRDAATMFVRQLTDEPNVMGEISGDYLSIYGCAPIHKFKIQPMNSSCSFNIPILYTLGELKGVHSYMNPITRIITDEKRPCNCKKATEILVDMEIEYLQLKDPVMIDGPMGEAFNFIVHPVHLFPQIEIKMTDIAEVIVPQLLSIDMNMFLVDLSVEDFQQTTERTIRAIRDIVEQPTGSRGDRSIVDPDEPFKRAKGPENHREMAQQLYESGFLATLFGKISFFSVWQFLCCIAVTVQLMNTFVLPFFFKTFFSYRKGGSMVNIGDNVYYGYQGVSAMWSRRRQRTNVTPEDGHKQAEQYNPERRVRRRRVRKERVVNADEEAKSLILDDTANIEDGNTENV